MNSIRLKSYDRHWRDGFGDTTMIILILHWITEPLQSLKRITIEKGKNGRRRLN